MIVPQREWLKDRNIRDTILEIVRHGRLVRDGMIDFGKFSNDYIKYSKQDELGNSFFIWKIINLEYLVSQKWR